MKTLLARLRSHPTEVGPRTHNTKLSSTEPSGPSMATTHRKRTQFHLQPVTNFSFPQQSHSRRAETSIQFIHLWFLQSEIRDPRSEIQDRTSSIVFRKS